MRKAHFCSYLSSLLLLLSVGAAAQFRTVTVQNANSNPVPTTIQNTPSVNISNTPVVTINGTPAVNVSNTPAVTVSGTPNVTVTNGVGSPVPTRNNDDDIRGAFALGGGGNILTSSSLATFMRTLPGNNPAELDYLSMIVTGVQSASVSYVEIDGGAPNSGVATNFFPVTTFPDGATGTGFILSAPTHIYLTGGQTITVKIVLNQNNTGINAGYSFSFQGHTVTP